MWFLGLEAKKIEAVQGTAQNSGYDDDNGSYIKVRLVLGLETIEHKQRHRDITNIWPGTFRCMFRNSHEKNMFKFLKFSGSNFKNYLLISMLFKVKSILYDPFQPTIQFSFHYHPNRATS